MPFPVHRLRPIKAEIWAVLFENSYANVPLGVYWSLAIRFERFEYFEQQIGCCLSADWIRLPVRNWRALENRSICGDFNQVEASFYTGEHDPAVYSMVRLGTRRGTCFDLEWESIVNYPGFDPSDADPRLRVATSTQAEFEGVLVPMDMIASATDSCERAAELLSPFLELSAFGRPELRTNEFGAKSCTFPPM